MPVSEYTLLVSCYYEYYQTSDIFIVCKKNYLYRLDCCIEDVWKLICCSKDAEGARWKWRNLGKRLGLSDEEITTILKTVREKVPMVVDGERDTVFQVLYRWTKELKTSPRLEILVQALISEGLTHAAGIKIYISSINLNE